MSYTAFQCTQTIKKHSCYRDHMGQGTQHRPQKHLKSGRASAEGTEPRCPMATTARCPGRQQG